MPQMSPYNWFMMFMLFNFIYLIMITINYYLYLPKFKSLKNINLYKKYNLKW